MHFNAAKHDLGHPPRPGYPRGLTRLAWLLVLCAAVAARVTAAPDTYQSAPRSADGIGKFYHQREIAHVMGFEGASWLERPERASEERPDLLVKALSLRPGMNVADIGAGSGYLSKRVAPLIAPGKVYAVDVQPEMVALLKTLALDPTLGNIVPVPGRADSVQLSPASIDLAFLVDVYHELEYPAEVIGSLVAALKSGGELVFVEYRGEDPRVPIKPLHKMTVKQLLLEMQGFPLQLERQDERLPLQHIVIFRKR